jgi:hypothetical protein
MMRPPLTVVQGSAGPAAPAWLDFPQTIRARSPSDKNEFCRFRLSREDATRAALAYRRQPIWEMWSIIIGEPPPVPNVKSWGINVPAEEGLTALIEAHACFRGIKRAIAEDDNGENVITFILKPRFFYEYRPGLVCVAAKLAVPVGLVFAAHARLDVPADTDSSTMGVVTHGAFVETDKNEPLLPEDHSDRYIERLW